VGQGEESGCSLLLSRRAREEGLELGDGALALLSVELGHGEQEHPAREREGRAGPERHAMRKPNDGRSRARHGEEEGVLASSQRGINRGGAASAIGRHWAAAAEL
jgi:hypothetical protein